MTVSPYIDVSRLLTVNFVFLILSVVLVEAFYF